MKMVDRFQHAECDPAPCVETDSFRAFRSARIRNYCAVVWPLIVRRPRAPRHTRDRLGRPGVPVCLIEIGRRFNSGNEADLAMGWTKGSAIQRARDGFRHFGITVRRENDMSAADWARFQQARAKELMAA